MIIHNVLYEWRRKDIKKTSDKYLMNIQRFFFFCTNEVVASHYGEQSRVWTKKTENILPFMLGNWCI